MSERNLSAAEYFMAIQREYMIAEFRKKIYFNPKDKRYYQKVMEYKAMKINDIANRNRLNSILNDHIKYRELRNELFCDNGMPKFDLNETDLVNYYSIGNEFQYNGDVCVLKQIKEDGSLIIYHIEKMGDYEVSPTEVSRIL